jgi:hypothetical protein
MSFWSEAMDDGGEKGLKDIQDKKDENDKSAKRRKNITCTRTMVFLSSLRFQTSLPNPRAMSERFIPPHGGYENLLSFRKARIVYDGTVWFCGHFLEKRDRTNDQMVQAARSGKQNILEGSQASGTPKETEIKLTKDLLDSPNAPA